VACDPSTINELEDLLAAIRGFDDPRRATAEWKRVHRLLQGTDLPSARATHVVGMRDVDGLTELLDRLTAPQDAPAADVPDAETCSRALKAFRKRLSLTILDEQSKLGHSPLTKGEDTRLAKSIAPPTEWPAPVWQELVRQGRLRYVGHGLYELTK